MNKLRLYPFNLEWFNITPKAPAWELEVYEPAEIWVLLGIFQIFTYKYRPHNSGFTEQKN